MAWHGTICMSIERSFTVSHINYATKLLYLSKEINLWWIDTLTVIIVTSNQVI